GTEVTWGECVSSSTVPPGGTEMEAGGLFATAVPEEQLQEGWEKSLERIFRPSQCLRSIEGPREVRYLPVIVRDRMQEVSMVQAELYQQRAEAFLQLCDFQSAMLNFRKALTLSPAQQQPCLERLALVLDLQGQCLLDQELYSLPILSCSIMCLAALNKFPECLQMVNRDLEEDVRNPDLYVLCASFYECFGQLALCHQDIQRALELEPQHGAAQALKQRLLRRGQEAKAEAVTKALCGDLRGALLKISFAIENDPLTADFFILRGTLLQRLKNFSAACEDFARARELGAEGGPEAREAWRQLVLTHNDCAVRCYALGLFDEAVRLLGEALRDEKREKGLYVNRGDCFLRLGELAYPLADYQQALELSPGDWGLVVCQAAERTPLSPRRQYQQAEARFSAAIEHDPHKPLYYLCRARTRVCRGGVEGAKEDIVLSLWLDPTDSEVQPWHHFLMPSQPVALAISSTRGAVVAAGYRLSGYQAGGSVGDGCIRTPFCALPARMEVRVYSCLAKKASSGKNHLPGGYSSRPLLHWKPVVNEWPSSAFGSSFLAGDWHRAEIEPAAFCAGPQTGSAQCMSLATALI
uniref:Tetratricopeptide repeat domain 16 n=1 Tax=Apteryx owenii TaxID=8824 RepID=A0A8B9PX79_APTOW